VNKCNVLNIFVTTLALSRCGLWDLCLASCSCLSFVEGIVHFEMNFWYVLAYLKRIQDVGVFVSAVVTILIFFAFVSGCGCGYKR